MESTTSTKSSMAKRLKRYSTMCNITPRNWFDNSKFGLLRALSKAKSRSKRVKSSSQITALGCTDILIWNKLLRGDAHTSPQLFGLNISMSPKSPAKVRSACSADLVLTPIGSLEPLRCRLVANHIIWLILEGAAGYVERIRHTRCRQANERRAESDGNNLK